MGDELYSIRMRASSGGRHITGAERITAGPEVQAVVAGLLARANGHGRGRPDSVGITVDSLAGKKILRAAPLPVRAVEADGVAAGREAAVGELCARGVSERAARYAMDAITAGAAPDGAVMRGAMVVDAQGGARLEPDMARGIRARAVDWDAEAADALKGRGIDNVHFIEALALASKVASAPFYVAELCISDDPGYVTGYAASHPGGYVRITPMKQAGDPMGGRAFFVDGAGFDINEFMRYMREVPVLVGGALILDRHSRESGNPGLSF